MTTLFFVPLEEVQRLRRADTNPVVVCQLLSTAFRINTLSMIMEAGSGHVGTSFSCMDIITWLWTQEMHVSNEADALHSDIYFSSKGHDAPALYSVLIGLERLDYNLIHKLRRLGGLAGHPDVVHTPQLATNTGPLGMGISKARGMAIANRLAGKRSQIYVLSGDGELQEGQIWESLQPAANGKFSEITLIVDHNKIQSDTWVKDVSDLGMLEEKFRSFGWEVMRCDGHDFVKLGKAFGHFRTVKNRPQVLIADTVKGKGVTTMERFEGDLYRFHSGAPSTSIYEESVEELRGHINQLLKAIGQESLHLESMHAPEKKVLTNPSRLVDAYGDELVKLGAENKDIVVLDGDLMFDCGLLPFKTAYPERFVECGIAEQDMVSVAGGLALEKKIPIVNSFACFLSTRPNEQIYNNASEKTKIIYVASLAGLLPSGPGHSHQSVRDISTLGSVPDLTMIQPCNELETRCALRWAVEKNLFSTYIRLVSIPRELPYQLPADYQLVEGYGIKLCSGTDAALIAYGPVMLSEAFRAAQIVMKQNLSVAVYNMPWLNVIDSAWLLKEFKKYPFIVALDDHYVKLGQGTLISACIAQSGSHQKVLSLGVEDIPECGQNDEVLQFHRLDSVSLADRLCALLKKS